MYQNTQCRYRWCQVHHQCQTVCQVCGWSSWHSCPDWYWRGHESWVSNHCSVWPGSSFPFVSFQPTLSLRQYVMMLSDDLKSQKCIMVDFTNILLLALSMGVATNGWRNLISKCYCSQISHQRQIMSKNIALFAPLPQLGCFYSLSILSTCQKHHLSSPLLYPSVHTI